jgi:sphinganine-1-phosphate aldolase
MSRLKVMFPKQGMREDAILTRMKELRDEDCDWKGGKTFEYVYHATKAHDNFLKKAHQLFFSENAINPMAFPSLKRFEAEVIAMVADLLGGRPTDLWYHDIGRH